MPRPVTRRSPAVAEGKPFEVSDVITPAHLERLNFALSILLELGRLLDMGRRAGQNLDDYERQRTLWVEKILARKRAYFPEEP